MKKLWILFCCVILSSVVFANIGSSAEIIFRPGPGLNDGTDQGGPNSGKDASAGSCISPADNFGEDEQFIVFPISNCNGCNSKAFIRFDVDSLPDNVANVYLGFTHLPHTITCLSNCAADFYFYPISSSWDEMTINLNNAPGHGSSVVGPIHITFPNDLGNQEYEITGLYQQWKSGTTPNYGIEISSNTVGCNNAAVYFIAYSSDAADESNRPYLRIVTEEAYSVTYDGNGNTGGAAPVDASSPYVAGVTVTVLNNTGSLVRDGFTFNGWNTAADGSGDSHTAGDTLTMPAAVVTLYAQWTAVSAAEIPTLSEWGMIVFTLLMAGIAIVSIRRRKDMTA